MATPTLKQSHGAQYTRIYSYGAARGDRVVGNDELVEAIDSSDEWIQQRTGIVTRTRSSAGILAVDLATDAAREAIERGSAQLKAIWARPQAIPQQDQERVLSKTLEREQRYFELLRRPQTTYATLMSLPGAPSEHETDPQVIEQIEIAAKYQGYIDRQQDEVEKNRSLEETRLPHDIDYLQVHGLSKEVQSKLNQHKPETVGQAARIQGITPAAVSLLLVHVKRGFAAARSAAEQKSA